MGFENEKKCVIPFGKATKHALYYLDPSIKFTNHGSYGTAPKYIIERKRELQMDMERCPDRWFRFTSFVKWEESIKALADYLKVDKQNVLLFENATESIGTILKWIEFDGCRDAILTTSINYQAILNAVDYTAKYRMKPDNFVNVFKIDIKFPIKSVDDVVEEFAKACHEIIEVKKFRLRLALVDHIASSTAIVYPIEKISKLIRVRAGTECIILIDGAHGIGKISLDFSPEKFHADFYVSNLHKWFLAPRSCAFLYTSNAKYLDYRFQPCYISHGYAPNPSNHSVSYNHYQRGTMDKTSQYVVPDCINFYENFLGGLDHIREYTSPLLERVLEMLEKEWGTKRLQVPEEMLSSFMRVIKLPELSAFSLKNHEENNWENKVVIGLSKHLLEKYNVVAFIGIVNGELICRITCFVYNEFDDFVALKDAILKVKNGE